MQMCGDCVCVGLKVSSIFIGSCPIELYHLLSNGTIDRSGRATSGYGAARLSTDLLARRSIRLRARGLAAFDLRTGYGLAARPAAGVGYGTLWEAPPRSR